MVALRKHRSEADMELWEPLKILSCGAGMQSTALALMSCENAVRGMVHDGIPVYSAILFCDLGHEPLS